MTTKTGRIIRPITSFLLIFALFAAFIPPHTSAAPPKAVYTRQTLSFNGQSVALDVYNIDEYTYFRLRDIAALCADTAYRFSTQTDDERKTVTLVRFAEPDSRSCTASNIDQSRTCVESEWSLSIDGKPVRCSVYNIDGNNFYRLRDLAAIIGFSVGYDPESMSVLVYAEPLADTEDQLKAAFRALSILGEGADSYRDGIAALADAVNGESAFAASILAEGYYKGLYGLPCDMTAAAKHAKTAAQGGSIRGSYLYGLLLWNGKGTVKDRLKAIEHFGRAAQGGDISALSFLAEANYRGESASANDRLAYLYSRSAANFEDPRAAYIYALCLYNGRGVSRDLEKAAQYFTAAASLGDADAMFSLGVCYYKGEGVRFNPYIALGLFERAADLGHEGADENARIISEWIDKSV